MGQKCDKARQVTDGDVRGSKRIACWIILFIFFRDKISNAKAPQLYVTSAFSSLVKSLIYF